MEAIKPSYYSVTIKGNLIDVIDIIQAYNLPFTIGSALKYIIRIKGDKEKRINDIDKAIECLNRERDKLQQEYEEEKGKY